MSLRSLLALLLLLALSALCGFIYLAVRFQWQEIALLVPQTSVLQFGQAISLHALLVRDGVLLLVLNMLVCLFLFLLIDRLFIRPVHDLATAMQAFAKYRTLTTLPRFSRATSEMRELADVFVSFTDSVEQVHEKDMDMSRIKSDFISTAAHQLRTPLTAIRWALEALQKENLTEGQQALIKNAADKSTDLVAIVGTLLDITAIESGKYKYHMVSTDVLALVEDVVRDFLPIAQQSKVTLYLEKDGTRIPAVPLDRDRIKWVLNNLVENALKYTPAEGTVRVSVALDGALVRIHVRDTGIGIPSADRSNIFERFYRAGNAITKENKGNGLGLYIARSIATDHGGQLSFAENQGGVGTTFTLSLPVAGRPV